jgi:hypothetical protein
VEPERGIVAHFLGGADQRHQFRQGKALVLIFERLRIQLGSFQQRTPADAPGRCQIHPGARRPGSHGGPGDGVHWTATWSHAIDA